MAQLAPAASDVRQLEVSVKLLEGLFGSLLVLSRRLTVIAAGALPEFASVSVVVGVFPGVTVRRNSWLASA